MLKKYTDIEQRALEDLGKTRNDLSKKLETERVELHQIQGLLDSMRAPDTQSALYYQNHAQITDRVRDITETQKVKVDLAYLELQKAHQSLIRQYGKVKGLEGVIEKKRRIEVRRLDKAEQSQQDELSARQFAQGIRGRDYQ